MQTSIESFLLINLSLDIILLCIVSKGIGVFCFPRIILAALVSITGSYVAVRYPDNWCSPYLQLFMIIPISMMIAGASELHLWGKCTLLLVSGIILTGGCVNLLNILSFKRVSAVFASLFAFLILSVLIAHKKHAKDNWNIKLCISANGETVRFTALIDTGNRLHEPFSGLPVIIAEAEILNGVLPENGYRNVAYGGLGGNGIMKCFKPDFIWIISGSKMRRAPDAWIALSPVPLPGISQALAPCEFASL